MNILFVNYGDFTTNSLNHIGAFANTLSARGHACVVAVPRNKDSLRHIARPLFIPATYEEALLRPNLFPNGKTADVIHAWTPRECVRIFVLEYQRVSLSAGASPNSSRLIIHLEDNEHFLLETFTGRSLSQLRQASAIELDKLLNESLSHPVRAETFLRVADGVTHIIDRLSDFAPPGLPQHLLFPGVEFPKQEKARPDTGASEKLRNEIRAQPGERVIVFTGSNTFANEPEMRDLYLAVALLNQMGTPTRLVRTGFSSDKFVASFSPDVLQHVTDLGFVAKERLAKLVALADVLVQPGRPGPFNDYRLPSKLPEFLASGRPVILPPTNVALLMRDGEEAVFLPAGGSPREIAESCLKIFGNPNLSEKLGRGGSAFARKHFDLQANTLGLLKFYDRCAGAPRSVDWKLLLDGAITETTLFADAIAAKLHPKVVGANAPEKPDAANLAGLLAAAVRQVEQGVELSVRGRLKVIESERDAIAAREQLTQNHIRNVEALLQAAREHATELEKARDLTHAHATNLEKELQRQVVMREQAEALFNSAGQQTSAFEKALLEAEAVIAAARQEIAGVRLELSNLEERERLAQAHARNIEDLLQAAQRNAADLEQARSLTQTHADNLQKERDNVVSREKLTQEHARHLEALLEATRLQVQELQVSRTLTQAHADNVEREREALRVSLQSQIKELETSRALTQAHADNVEREREALRVSLQGQIKELESARTLTQAHADNLQKEILRQISLREKSDAARKESEERARTQLDSASRQVIAYERALHGADEDIHGLKAELGRTRDELAASRDETTAALQEQARLRTSASDHEALLRAHHAAEMAVAADKLAQAQAVVKSREEKIAKIHNSFSWKLTAPLRALRRRFVDERVVPAASPALLGNVDHPQDWSAVAATLNVRGWSLHRSRLRLKAIRAKLGETTAHAVYGDERLDVMDHFRDHPGADRCGWQVKVDMPRRGSHLLVIEVQDEANAWHVVHARNVKRSRKAAPPPPNTYGAWVAAYDTLTPQSTKLIRERISKLRQRPLISVVLPVYNTPEKLLVAAIESVRRQVYENWELCISDDASKQPHVRKVLERYRRKDPRRIKVVFRETNGHISANSNSALALAQGEFIALLDHDDELRAHALACVALEINAHPKADVIYSDEDKIDENGHRYDHYFKPDWNPDLFNVQNFISHLGVYRTLLVREVGGFRVGYEGSQDWDLAMRVIERSAPDRIRHIPKILYHWRSVPGSTAMLIGEKPFAAVAAQKVIAEHFVRTGVEVTVSPTKGSYWRIHYPIPEPAPRVTLIIPTRNRLNVLRPCIDSLRAKTAYPNFEILIIDNDSDDPETLAYLEQISLPGPEGENGSVRVVREPGEFNYSALNNRAVELTDAPLVGLLNNDLEVIHGDWLGEMVSHAIRPEIGCVGSKLYYPDDRIQHAGVILGIGGVAAHAWQTHPRGAAGQAHRNYLQQNLSAVTAACLLVRREVYLSVGGLNAEQLKVAFNDVDFCLKVRAAGYRNLWTPYAELYHHESASRGKEDTLEKRDRFRSEVEYMRATWGQLLDNDPAYNPNLTLTINDFTLALPPRDWPPLK